jgi:hypothetical protein
MSAGALHHTLPSCRVSNMARAGPRSEEIA